MDYTGQKNHNITGKIEGQSWIVGIKAGLDTAVAIGIRIAGGSQRSIRIPILGLASGIVDLNPRSIVQVLDQEEVEFQVTLTHQATSRLDIRSVQLTNQAKDLDSDTETTRLNDGKVLLKTRPHLMKQKIIRGKVWVNMEIDDVRERSSIPFVLVRS